MADDAARGEVVLFGGAGSSGLLNDTWVWRNGSVWVQMSPAHQPPARFGHSMAYDAASGQVVLFGGLGADGALGDTWTWNGTDWTQQTLTPAPPGRYAHSLAYDAARGQVVLFGGVDATGFPVGDTWVWQSGTAQTATIRVISATHTAGTGGQPAVTKAALALQLKVYDAVQFASLDPKSYGTVFENPAITPVAASMIGPTSTTFGGGPANLYTLQAPAGAKYLVIGKGTVGTTAVYLGDPTAVLAAGASATKYLQVIINGAGKIVPGKVTEVPGSLLLITEPQYIEFTSDTELVPVVYESVEGAWNAVVTAEPPEGFVSNPGAIPLNVTDNTLSAAQFSIRDVGSSWTHTKLTHRIHHKGKTTTIVSTPRMINNKRK